MVSPRTRLRKSALKAGFRSGLEQDVAAHLKANGVSFEYEKQRISFIPKSRTYTPDFVLENGIIIEAKGRFVSSDRAKHLLIKEQHPHLDVRFVFSNANNRLSKGSKTTYADWCKRHGFLWAEGLVPISWMKEKPK